MSFSATQVAKAMFYLEAPAVAWAKSTIQSAMERVTESSAELEAEVGTILTDLDNLYSSRRTHITGSAGVQVETTGQVNFKNQAITEFKHEEDRLKDKLQLILGVDFRSNSDFVSFG